MMQLGACRAPIVLPYYHSGMGDVVPYKGRFPRMGHTVTVTFGDPVDLRDLTCNCNVEGCDQMKLWQDITVRVSEALLELERQSEPNTDQYQLGRAPRRYAYNHDRKSQEQI
jgi:monolysocardiolipin acyltransferase